MTEKKRSKKRSSPITDNQRSKKRSRAPNGRSKTLTLTSKEENKRGKKRKSGPRLPSSFRKELELQNPKPTDSDEDEEFEEHGDLYEYEEEKAEEESRRNRRYDPVENYEYELPEDFKDENVPSDDDDEDIPSGGSDGDDGEGDKHLRMLGSITGMPSEAFDGKEKKEVVLTDLQGDLGHGKLSISDLLIPLQGKAGYNKLNNRLHQVEKVKVAQPPLPEVERKKVERMVGDRKMKEDLSRWEPLIKSNREARTLYFQEDVNVGFSTEGTIASEFEPRTDFEKKMAALVRDPEVTEAHLNDGAKLLEFNQISVEDVRERQNRLAKMRSLLFCHELKAKRIKKIKSKTFHRNLKKDRLKTASAEMELDPEAIKEQAMKQEFRRAEERMTLKHKNSTNWAKRIMKRGLEVQDEATRANISEQLRQHALLTRKMNSMKASSSDESSSDDDDDDELAIDRKKEKILKVMEEEDEMPKSELLSLPFMVRGLQKQKEAAEEEARLALQEYETMERLDEGDGAERQRANKPSGRKIFGATNKQSQQPNKMSDNTKNSDSEDDMEYKEHEAEGEEKSEPKEVHIGSALLDEDSDMGQKAVFQKFDEIIKDPGPKTTYDVAMFASGSWKKMKGDNGLDLGNRKALPVPNSAPRSKDIKVIDQNSDSDSEEEMVDGVLSAGAKTDYELPSQADLIHRAFAGDDVEAEFEKDKAEVLNEENPEPEKPVSLPGWGQWTNVQKKLGPPSWMLEEHKRAKRKRDEALKKRKDSTLMHVIISEKIDKKAEKLHANTLPFPYKSKDVYEQSIRMPLGPEYNPAISVGELNRPAVVKKAGIIIKPIKYKKDPHSKTEEPQRTGQRSKVKNSKTAAGAKRRRHE